MTKRKTATKQVIRDPNDPRPGVQHLKVHGSPPRTKSVLSDDMKLRSRRLAGHLVL